VSELAVLGGATVGIPMDETFEMRQEPD